MEEVTDDGLRRLAEYREQIDRLNNLVDDLILKNQDLTNTNEKLKDMFWGCRRELIDALDGKLTWKDYKNVRETDKNL